MEIENIQTAAKEHEQKQKSIKELLDAGAELVDENFKVQVERNNNGELAAMGKLTDDQMEEEYRHWGDFLIPEGDGIQTLDIHFLAADPYVDPHDEESVFAEYGPDAVAKFVHNQRAENGDVDMEIADVYIVRKTPDGDYVLEKSLRDSTTSNRNFNDFRRVVQGDMGHTAVASAVESYSLNEADRHRAAGAVLLEERQFGLHDSDDGDLEELKKLLKESEIRE